MKVKTIKRFKDKRTKKMHEVGDVFEVTEKRLEEIRKVSEELVEMISEDEAVENEEPVEKPKRGKAAPKKEADAE